MSNKYRVIIPVEGVLAEPFISRAVTKMSRNMPGINGLITRAAYKIGVDCPFQDGRAAINSALKFGAHKNLSTSGPYSCELAAVRDLIGEYDVTLLLDGSFGLVRPVVRRLHDIFGDNIHIVSRGTSGMARTLKRIAGKAPAHTWFVTYDMEEARIAADNHLRTAIINPVAQFDNQTDMITYHTLAEFAADNLVRGGR